MKDMKTLEYTDCFNDKTPVGFDIQQYLNNGNMYIGLMGEYEDGIEPYGDLTVNLGMKTPDYCGFVDVNNMGNAEKFIKENELGEFTGIAVKSGYVDYPLYQFSPEKLKELCPDGIAMYEANIGKARQPEPKNLAR